MRFASRRWQASLIAHIIGFQCTAFLTFSPGPGAYSIPSSAGWLPLFRPIGPTSVDVTPAVVGFARFWYDFIVSDDWTVAAVVIIVLIGYHPIALWSALPRTLAGDEAG